MKVYNFDPYSNLTQVIARNGNSNFLDFKLFNLQKKGILKAFKGNLTVR